MGLKGVCKIYCIYCSIILIILLNFILYTKTNEVKEFTNQTEAGEFLGVTRQAIYNAIKRNKPIKEIFIVSK